MILIDLAISGLLIFSLILLTIKPKRFKKYIVFVVASALLIFGFYIWIKNGLILDYGTTDEILKFHSDKMIWNGIISMAISILYLSFRLIKLIFNLVKK